jgi:NTP pyrophosphatase (non-canonical NTP hydrolase)
MTSRVIEPALSGDDIKTEYVNIKGNMPYYINRKADLHDPMRFGIGAPIVVVAPESEHREIYNRALSRWGVGLQLDMFIEESAEAIQAVQHYKRGRCDMDTVCGELADLWIMLSQMRIVYGETRFDRVLAEKIAALYEKLSVEE